MKQAQYKDFSLRTHLKNWRLNKPNMCRFELTFSCALHCQHCYSDCYNNPYYIKKELPLDRIKYLLDKVRDCGVFWLHLTGGDPLARRDFLEVYSYAKRKGFVIILFTNGFSLTKNIVDFLARFPPFNIEVTLNAISKKTFEAISGVEGSFEKTIKGIELIRKRNIALKIKTMLLKKNLGEIPKIKKFVENLGLEFNPSPQIAPRLNRDLTPCFLRLEPEEVLKLEYKLGSGKMKSDCRINQIPEQRLEKNKKLFRCAVAGGDGFIIDPYGRMFLCPALRDEAIDLLKVESIPQGIHKLSRRMRARRFKANSKCGTCQIAGFCMNCPGNAYLETGDLEAGVDWFCQLAYLAAGKKVSQVNC